MPCGHITSVYLEYGCILYLANHDVWLGMVSRNPKNGMIDEDGCLTLWISLWLWLCLIHRRLWNIDWAMFIELLIPFCEHGYMYMEMVRSYMKRWFDLLWWMVRSFLVNQMYMWIWVDLFWWTWMYQCWIRFILTNQVYNGISVRTYHTIRSKLWNRVYFCDEWAYFWLAPFLILLIGPIYYK